MDIKVSVIMPSKNVVAYIGESIESVLNQTLDDIEVIVVDAFSTDGTREIINNYVKSDRRVILLDDELGSCGYAYNKGIKSSRGKYIGFVETDDYIADNMLEEMYDCAESNDLDYVKANHIPFINIDDSRRLFEEERVFESKEFEKYYGTIINPSVMPEIMWPDHCMWNGIYNREFVINNDIFLNESPGPSYQDHGFQWKSMTKAKRAMYLDKGFYFYRKDNESASMNNPKGLIRDFDEYMYIRKNLKDRDDIFQEHWGVFYQKMFYSIMKWCEKLVDDYGRIPSEADVILKEYQKELDRGIYNYPIVLLKLGGDYGLAELFTKNKDGFLEELMCRKVVRKKQLSKVLERIKDSRIVIFGAGKWGKRLYITLFKELGKDIEVFCDNGVSQVGNRIADRQIISVEQAVVDYPDAVFIIANNLYYMDCTRQLIGLGIDRKKIVYYKSMGESF